MKRSHLTAIAMAITLTAAPARADDATRQACRDAYEGGQELRKAGRLRDARARFAECARNVCPSFVQTDCARWGDEIATEQPSLMFVARRSDGTDVSVRVSADGVSLPDYRAGVWVEIDPGEHDFRFESEGLPPVEQHVVVRLGEKKRTVAVTFPPPPSAPSGRTAGPSAPSTPATTTSGLRVAALASAGVAALSGLTFGVLATHGKLRENELSSSCAPDCNPDRVSALRTEYRAADVALAVGVGAAVLAGVFYLASPARAPRAVAVYSF